ncbi:MAG: hypothetical protein U0791_05970 [Gemmataceae bacterium]
MAKYILEGRVYDEDDAELVHEYESRHPQTDLRWVRESLYKTQSGRFFVTGEGGSNSHFAETEDEQWWSPGEGGYLLSDAEALEWLVSRGAKAEVIEEHFSLPVG